MSTRDDGEGEESESETASTAGDEGQDSWYLALEPSHKHLSKDVGYRKQVQMKLQKRPHVMDVQGIRRIAHLYGSTAMFASQAKTNACHWGDFAKTHKAALDQAHQILESEGYTNSRTRNAAKTVYVPVEELESRGFKPEIGGPIPDTKAFELLQRFPQPFHSKSLPSRLRLGWDIEETLHETDNEDSDRKDPPTSRAQELFTTPHRADKMAPGTRSTKKRAAEKASPTNDFHETIESGDEVIAMHSLACFAKEACEAEQEIGFLFELHTDSGFLKTCTEAVKVLPEQIKTTQEIIERYANSSKSTQQSNLSFVDKVKKTLPGPASPESRDCFVIEKSNPFATPSRNPFNFQPANPRASQGSPSGSRSAYAPRFDQVAAPKQVLSDAGFYKDLSKDLAKLAQPNKIERFGEVKTVEVEGKGKIALVAFTSRSDSWLVPELWAACLEKFIEDNRVDDLKTTSLNFWAGVLRLQDIKTRFGFQANDDGTFIKQVPQEAFQVSASRYADLHFGNVNRNIARAICYYRQESINKRDRLTTGDVQRELAGIVDKDLAEILGFDPKESPFGVASGSGLIELD